MKKALFLSLALAVSASASYGQFYLRAGLGYAMPQASNTISGAGLHYMGSYNDSTGVYNLKAASFTTGLWGDLGLGYLFNEHVGVQLDAMVGIFNKKYDAEIPGTNFSGVPSTITITQQIDAPLILVPSLVLKTGGNPWDAYCRFGLALPVNTKMTQHEIIQNLPNTGLPTTYNFTSQISNYFSIGIAACAGLEYKLNNQTAIWGEVGVLSMALYIKQSQITGVDVNGTSYPNSSVSPQQINYNKNGTVSNGNDISQQATYSQPFSNVSFMAGIRFNLSAPHQKKSSNHTEEGYDRTKPYRRR